jgi:hypothetical protein
MIELYAATILSVVGYLLMKKDNNHNKYSNLKSYRKPQQPQPQPIMSNFKTFSETEMEKEDNDDYEPEPEYEPEPPHPDAFRSEKLRWDKDNEVLNNGLNRSDFAKQLTNPDMYTMTNLRDSKEAEMALAMARNNINKKLGVVPNIDRLGNNTNGPVKSLSGNDIDPDDFLGSDVLPFFGGSVKQNVEEFGNDPILELHTGKNTFYESKKEENALFSTSKEIGNVYGNSSKFYEIEQNRIIDSHVRDNELPFEQQRIGPGLGLEPDDGPIGGFQQAESRDYGKNPTVDDLRVGSNPKISYKTPVTSGLKTSLSSREVKLAKNRVNTYYEQTPDMLLTSVADVTKATSRPNHINLETHRATTTESYSGSANANIKPTSRGNYKKSSRNVLSPFQTSVVSGLGELGQGNNDDHGRKCADEILRPTERERICENPYQGNLGTAIKAITVPFTDFLRLSKKEYLLDNPRQFGQFNVQVPEKMTVYDSDGITRTTIKETLIHDTVTAGVQLPSKGIVYDPSDKARKTGRETIEQDEVLNLKGANKHIVYDPEEIAKRTMRETTENKSHTGNLYNKTAEKGGYTTAPRDMHNTQKQFISDHEYSGAPEREDTGRGYITSACNEPPEPTSKQFISDYDYTGTGSSHVKRGSVNSAERNIRTNPTRENTLTQREPTKTSTKDFNYETGMFRDNRKIPENISGLIPCTGSSTTFTPSKDTFSIQSRKKTNDESDRLDPDNLLVPNPIIQSFQSFA